MTKAKKYAINGAILLGIINAIINSIKQHNAIKQDPNLTFNWQSLLLATGKGALVGGSLGFGLGAYVDYENSKVKPANTDKHLVNLADSFKLDKTSSTYVKLNEKAEQLIKLLNVQYGSSIQTTPRLGSTEKGTALKAKFDIDFGVNFKAKSFRSTEEMFFSVLNYFEKLVGRYSIIKFRDQNKSIGVFVLIDDKEHKIDVVPCKLTLGANGSGFLYVNDNSIFGNSSSYTKTSIKVLNNVKLSLAQQRIVVVLKKWREKNNLPLSSHLIESLILDAYKYSVGIPRSFTSKVVMVFRHIANNLDVAVIRGVENKSNIITNIPTEDKDVIISACRQVIEDYEYQPNSILSIIN